MERKYSIYYGWLSYISRKDYLSGAWFYVESEEDGDGEFFDIVRNYDGSEWHWTNI